MSAPSTGVPAQGGVTPTAVEEAVREVVALQAKEETKKLEARVQGLEAEKAKLQAKEETLQEEKGKLQAKEETLQAQITALEKRFDGEDVDLKEAGVTGLGQLPNEDTIKVKIAELKESLKFVNKQLAPVNERLTSVTKQVEGILATQQKLLFQREAQASQGTKRTHEKADLGSSGYTPEGKQRAAHGPSTGRVSPRTLEPVAAAHAWKVDLCLPRGLVYRGLRRKLYEFAGQRLAFDADIQYVPVDGQFTLDSDLRFTAYTMSENEAGHLMRDILHFCAKRVGDTFTYRRDVRPEYVEHTVRQSTFAFHYKAEDSPDVEDREEEPREPDPPSTTVVPEDRARNEFVIGAEIAYRNCFTPESCHLLEKHDYSKASYPLIEGDYANRIILEPNLHNMFDRKSPAITFFCETPSANLSECATPPCELTLVARFAYAVHARDVGDRFRESQARGPTDVAFKILHPRPRAFVRYLHLRHALNCKAMHLEHKIQDDDFVRHFNSLKSMTVSELKGKAQVLGVEGRSNMCKDQLLDAVLHATIHCAEFSSETTSDF